MAKTIGTINDCAALHLQDGDLDLKTLSKRSKEIAKDPAFGTEFKSKDPVKGKKLQGKLNIKARISAVDELAVELSKEYKSLEESIQAKNGKIPTYEEYMQQFSPEPSAEVATQPVATTPIETIPDVDPIGSQSVSDSADKILANMKFKQRARKQLELAAKDNDIDIELLAGMITPDGDGRVGRKEIETAIKELNDAGSILEGIILSETPKATAIEMSEQDVLNVYNLEKEAFEKIPDPTEQEMADYEENVKYLMGVLDDISGESSTDSLTAKSKSIYHLITESLSETDKVVVRKLSDFYKGKGLSQNEANRKASISFMQHQAKARIAAADNKAKALEVDENTDTRSSPTQRITDELNTNPVARVPTTVKGEWVDPRMSNRTATENEKNQTVSRMIEDIDGEAVVGLPLAKAIARAPRRVEDGKTIDSQNFSIKYVEGREPVKFISDKRENGGTRVYKDGKFVKYTTVIKRDQVAYYDPITNDIYKDEKTLRMARGEMVTPTPAERAATPSPDALEEKKAQIKEETKKELKKVGEDKPASIENLRERMLENLRIIQSHRQVVGDGTADAMDRAEQLRQIDENAEIPEGQLAAIMSKKPNADGTHDYKVISRKQLDAGINKPSVILGKKPIADWVFGRVDMSLIGGKGGRHSPDMIIPFDEAPASTQDIVPNESKRAFPEDQLSSVVIPDEVGKKLLDMPLPPLAGIGSPLSVLIGIKKQGIKSGEDLHRFALALDNSNWPKDKEGFDQIVSALRATHEEISKIAPNGIERSNNVDKQTSMQNVSDILSRYTDEEKSSVMQLIQDLTGSSAPRISEGRQDEYITLGGEKEKAAQNGVSISRETASEEGQYTPATVIAHEVSHWAYLNILTSEDRLEFWDTVSKYYSADGKFDEDALNYRLIRSGKANDANSPQEFFANQFEAYLASNGKYNMGNESLYKRLSQYITELYNRATNKKLLDKDLEPLFAKLLMGDEKFEFAAKNPKVRNPPPLLPYGELMKLRWQMTDDVDKNLHDALLTEDPTRIINAVGEVIVHLYQLVPSKSRAARDGKVSTGALKATRKIRKQIRSKADKLRIKVLGQGADSEQVFNDNIISNPHRDSDLADEGYEEYSYVDSDYEGEDGNDSVAFDYNDFENGYSFFNLTDPNTSLDEIIQELKVEIFDSQSESGSLSQILKRSKQLLEEEFVRRGIPTGETLDDYVDSMPESFRTGVHAVEPLSPLAKLNQSRARNKKERIANGTDKLENILKDRASQFAAGKLGKLERSGKPLPDLNGLSIRQLADIYTGFEGTKEGSQILTELLRKEKLTTEPVGKPRAASLEHSKKIQAAKKDELEAMLTDAFESGNTEEVTRIIWETQRRSYMKARSRIIKNAVDKNKAPVVGPRIQAIMPVKTHSVGMASKVEQIDYERGAPDGIPTNARFGIREAMGYFVHRNPEVQHDLRTMAYRMFNLMGRSAKATMEDANILSMDDVMRLSGRGSTSAGVTGVMADFTSPEFKNLRNDLRRMTVGLNKGSSDPFDLMHEVGHVLMRTNMINDKDRGEILGAFLESSDGIKKNVSRRNYDELPVHDRLERQAEEWFVEHWAQYLAERTSKGDVFSARNSGSAESLNLRSAVGSKLDTFVEGAAYFLNGVIGRKDIKQIFRRLTVYGDIVHGNSPRKLPVRNRGYVPANMAAQHFNDMYESASHIKKSRIHDFINGGLLKPEGTPVRLYHGTPNMQPLEDGEVVFQPSASGNFGAGIYVTTNAEIADQVYAQKPTLAAWTRMIEGNPNLSEGQKITALENARSASSLRTRISNKRIDRQDFLSGRGDYANEGVPSGINSEITLDLMNDEIEKLEFNEMNFHKTLKNSGVDYNAGVLTVYARVNNPIDLRRTTMYTVDDSTLQSMMRFGMLEMLSEGKEMEQIREAYRPMNYQLEISGSLTGDEVYMMSIKALQSVVGSKKAAQQKYTEYFGQMGYDAIQSTHQNTLTGERVPHETFTLIETFDDNDNWRSPAFNIKSQDAQYFDEKDARLYYSDSMSQPASLTAALSMIRGEGSDSASIATMLDNAETKGTDPELTSGLRKIAKGRALNEEDINGIREASVAERLLSKNSQRMRKTGMNWLANYVENYYPSVYNKFARSYMPIKQLMNELPDRDGVVKNWVKSSNPFVKGNRSQPASHTNVLKALRRGNASRAYAVLTAPEKVLFNKIKGTMRGLHTEMVDNEVMVGDIENYMPQVWNIESIGKDQESFTRALTMYLKSENSSRTTDEAKLIADRITNNLMNDDGLYIPPPVSNKGGVEGHLDFQRLLRIDKTPELYDLFEPFMENNLDGLLVKYMDGASKRIHQTKKIGVNVHAYADYMDIGESGIDAVVRQLSTPRIFTKEIKGQDPISGVTSASSLEKVMSMPFQTEEQARPFAMEALDQYLKHGKVAAKDFMINLLPQEKRTKTYERRVDAIANAMSDFKLTEDGRPTAINRSEFDHAEGTLRTLQGKQVNPRESQKFMNASRNVRAINNISLLSFTVLTSIPDAVLPLIRSGSFRSWMKGISQYATDPDYRSEIKNTGIAIENALHSRMVGMYGADATGVVGTAQNAFFNATMLTPWTDMWRGLAGAVALESFNTQVKKAAKSFDPSLAEKDQSREYKFAYRYLNRYGMSEWLKDPTKSLDPSNDEVALGMIKFANDTIFSPNPDDVPLAYQTPAGSILFQLKSFPLLMGRMAKDVLIDDVKSGNFKRPLYFAAFAPALGMAAIGTKDLVQQRGGEDGESAEFRARSAGKYGELLGYNADVHGDLDTFLGWYFEGLTAAGGFGLIGDMMHDVASQADNGAYGVQRAAGTILGPTFGLGASVVNVMGGAKEATLDVWDKGTTGTNSKQRLATREILGRLPVLGGIKSVKEASVDFFAGEKTDRKRKSSGWGSSWN
tara:strand:- start:15448 stop:24144 length:8697 start_codon:yes stop_codon:yes gene_type:complete